MKSRRLCEIAEYYRKLFGKKKKDIDSIIDVEYSKR